MAAFQNLRFHDFIVHIVDHKKKRLQLSTRQTPLGAANSFVHGFFAEYIQQAVEDENKRLACFQASPGGIVANGVTSFLEGRASFVDLSQSIARRLYEVMSESRYASQINPGDVIVASFTDGAERNGKLPLLAILKIDPSDAVIRHVRTEGGQQWVEFEESEERIPDPDENRIQKIAVVHPERQTAPQIHDLVVLDNDIRRKGEIAHFFYDDFLKAELNRDPKITTAVLLRETKGFVTEQSDVVDPPLKPEEQTAIIERVEQKLQLGGRFTPRSLVDAAIDPLDRPAPDRDQVLEAFLERLETHPRADQKLPPDQEVEVDSGRASEIRRRLKYELDRNVKITGDADALRQMVTIGRQGDGSYVLTIQSATLSYG